MRQTSLMKIFVMGFKTLLSGIMSCVNYIGYSSCIICFIKFRRVKHRTKNGLEMFLQLRYIRVSPAVGGSKITRKH